MDEKYVADSAVEGREGHGMSRRNVMKLGAYSAIGAGAYSAIGAVGMGLVGCGNDATGATAPVVRDRPSQDPSKIWLRGTLPLSLLDTPEIIKEMNKARDLAGDNYSLLSLQRLLCADIDDTYTIVQTPGANVIPPDAQSTGRKEVSAVPTKVFDNVYYVGGMEVGGWVIDTGAGYIMLDASYDYGYEEILLPNMNKLGLDPAKVKYILVTHAGSDHVGCLYKFQRDYPGIQVIFNNTIKANPAYLPYPPVATVMKDGDTLTLGDTKVTMVYTPRNVGGDGFSYFIPVKINGISHMWATYGNTGIGATLPDKTVYRDSMAKFLTYVDKLGADIAISSHPFVDASLARMKIIRDGGSPNPFLMGVAEARRYFEIMDQAVVIQTMRQQAGLNSSGTKLL